MSEPINLNQARKARGKAQKRRQADANAVRFGRTKAERQLDAARARKAGKDVDKHRLDDDT